MLSARSPDVRRFIEFDGEGAVVRFSSPYGIALDAARNMYVTDYLGQTVRKITPSGLVSTVAGKANSTGFADGVGASALFFSPRGIVVDSGGNLIVADEANSTVRKITPAGTVTTVAGAGSAGYVDGPAASARFFALSAITNDAAGSLFVADTGNQTVRKISPSGVVTTLAGLAGSTGSIDATGSAARFTSLQGITNYAQGNLYVTDGNAIRKISAAGVVTTLAGKPNERGDIDGQGAAARFSGPHGIKVGANGNLFVADTFNNTIRMITPVGAVTTVAGVAGRFGVRLGALPGGLSQPYDLALLNDKSMVVTTSNSVVQITLP